MKTYNTYKKSGVEWLGEIPEHWEILPGLSFIYENKDRNKGMIRNVVLSLSYGKIRVKGENELTGLVPESFETYQFVNKGDLIFRPTDLQNDTVSLRSSISEYEGIITNAYLNLRFRPKANSKFYHYFFRSIDNNKIIYGLGSGLRQNISYLDFRRFQFPFPPLDEQTAIAHFLDDKTTKIDQAIAIKQKQIELLKERMQILIHKAVTRGLNDKVKLKNSGVEWIGEIPEHWEVKKVKYLLKERNERSKNGLEPLLMMSQVHGLVVRSEFHSKAEVAQSSEGNKVVYKNDLVFNKLKAHLGVFFKSTIEYNGIVSPDYAVYQSTGVINDLKFLELLFRNPEYIKEFICRATGIVEGLIRLYTADLFDIHVAIPSKEEETEILEFIKTATTKIATAISIKEQEIEKLKEYKMSLIDGVVTGKVRVMQ